MAYCIKCGAKLTEKAEYCIKCGAPIHPSDETSTGKQSIIDHIDESAQNFGKKVEGVSDRIEKRVNVAGVHLKRGYDKSFNIAGPLIGAFIGLIIIRIIIYAIQASGRDIFILTALSEGALDYLLIILASLLLSGYNTYFYRNYKAHYQWMYPGISAIGFIITAWIAAQILVIISQSNSTPILGAIGHFINTYLIGIFILALIIAYGAQFSYTSYVSKEVKQCSQCNIDIDSDAGFCRECGKKQE